MLRLIITLSFCLPLFALALSAEDVQNGSFDGASLINTMPRFKIESPVVTETVSQKINLTRDYALPIHNGRVELSNDTHVVIYSNGAALQMQY